MKFPYISFEMVSFLGGDILIFDWSFLFIIWAIQMAALMKDFISELKKSWGLLDCNEVRMGDGDGG